ncbi:MAG: hypothetical protein ACE5ER_10495 [Nitrospinaceae bacterium]
MATMEQLKTHITKAKKKVGEAAKKAGKNKYDPGLRDAKKKVKRLTRKVGKIVYMEKKKAEKQKNKGGDAAE